MPPVFAIVVDRKNSNFTILFTLLNDFLKMNTGSHSDKFHIILCDIKFYISLF